MTSPLNRSAQAGMGSGVEGRGEQGASPSGSGSCPSGEAATASSSLRDRDPSRAKPDWFNECAREIGKLPPEWQWFKLEVIGDYRNSQGVMVTGAVTQAVFTRGWRKGEPKWSERDRTTERQVFVSHEAIDARKARYEAETGLCRDCLGAGQVVWRICSVEGASYRECRRCAGTGDAPASGTTARSAETSGLGPRGNGPAPSGETPSQSPDPLSQTVAPSTEEKE